MHYKRNNDNNITANFLLTLADKKGFISKTIRLKARPINLLEPNIRLVLPFDLGQHLVNQTHDESD